MCFEGVPARPYISGGDRFTWKVLAEYSWCPTTARSGSYKRGKVHSCAIPYSRTSYAYEQSHCPGSDKGSMSSSLILFNMDGPYQLRQMLQKSSRPNLKTSEGSSRHGRLNSLA